MNMESIFHRGERGLASRYPDVSPTQLDEAKKYLELVVAGKIKNINTNKASAEESLSRLRDGGMSEYVIRGHAADYLDFINNVERN